MEYFTTREKEVINLLVEGLNNNEISAKLCITRHTTKAHLATIYKKLNVDNRVQAAIKCVKLGLDIQEECTEE